MLLLSHFSRVRLCDPIDSSPPCSAVARILQARTLEWVAISFSNVWQWKVKVNSLSHVQLLTTPWNAAYQAPLPMFYYTSPQILTSWTSPSLKESSSWGFFFVLSLTFSLSFLCSCGCIVSFLFPFCFSNVDFSWRFCLANKLLTPNTPWVI